jgi:hypothetical protein
MTFHVFNTLSDPDNNIVGVCDYICCDTTTQETCYAWDNNGNIIPSCAVIADGGCPCPDGYQKCGAGKIRCLPWQIAVHSLVTFCVLSIFPNQSDLDNGIVGYCSDICCNAASHETCYDWARGAFKPYCAEIAVGGCPKRSGAGECMCCYFSKNNVFNILTLLPFYTL